MKRILQFIALDIFRNRVIIFYTLVLAAFSWTTFILEGNADKAVLSMLNIILLMVPLVSILFPTIYIYNSSEFIELMASHPVKRSTIWNALFAGIGGSMLLAFLAGTGIPVLLYLPLPKALLLLSAGALLGLVFVSLAFLCSILTRDKARGIGIAIMVWLFFGLLFDGLVLFLLFQLGDYPIEKWMVAVTALNPVDLTRIFLLLQLDAAAMMGYTGAVFKSLLGSAGGLIFSFFLLLLWTAIPYGVSLFKFTKKNL